MPLEIPIQPVVTSEVRRRMRADDDGGLWLVFFDRTGVQLLCLGVEEGTHSIDELFRRHLVELIRHVDAHRVVLAIHRPDGRPRRADRMLWREISRRLADEWPHQVDLLVVGDETTWAPRPRPRRRAA
ncbi:MAG TPA: hypothetical protein VFT62_10905 [Mycobacteriales bacterium]|nr:hypothetical protein [Mycobacteriales bacterium]